MSPGGLLARRSFRQTSGANISSGSRGQAPHPYGSRPFRMARLAHRADSGLGIRAVLFAFERLHDAGVSERRYNSACRTYLASISIVAYIFKRSQFAIFAGAIVLKPCSAGICAECTCSGHCDRNLHCCRRPRGGDLHEVIQTVSLGRRARCCNVHRAQSGWRLGRFRASLPRFLPHDEGSTDHDFPWTGIFFGAPILASGTGARIR